MEDKSVILEPLKLKRKWFDESSNKMAYRCLSIASANVIGWGLAFPENISFIWDGETSDFQNHVKILSGEKYIRVADNGTIAFNTYFSLSTDKHVTIMVGPVPNQFFESWSTVSATFSTSFYLDHIQAAIVLLKANEIITIKAGTPIAAIIPISLTELNNSKIEVFDYSKKDFTNYNHEYSKCLQNSQKSTKLLNFYKNATNHKNKKIGDHEVKYLNLKTVDGENNV
jgi:hypothetical protein